MSNNNEGQSFVMRDEKYDSPEYPRWLCEEGRSLYDSDLSFRCDCDQHGSVPLWQRVLNRQAQSVANAE